MDNKKLLIMPLTLLIVIVVGVVGIIVLFILVVIVNLIFFEKNATVVSKVFDFSINRTT